MDFLKQTRLALVGVLLAAAMMQPSEVTAKQTADGAFMVTTGKTSQPIGHYDFCRDHSDECGADGNGRDPRVQLTPQLWNQLVQVNAAVNTSIKAETDEDLYGRPEVWTYPTTAGDCEDLVLLKRRDLIDLGWPEGTLLITVVRQRNGEGHAVLTVLTDRGDMILDNLQPRVRVWTDTDYQYVKRQSETNAGQWMAIDDARTVSVGSLSR